MTKSPSGTGETTAPTPPVAEIRVTTTELHGLTRKDPYAWLKDPNWQSVMRDPAQLDPEIRAYLEAENAYTAAVLAPTEELQETLFQELKARIKPDDATVPAPDGDYLYYRRFEADGQHPVFCRRRADPPGGEEVLLDGNREAAGQAYFRIAACRHSPDHRLLAYAVDVNGSEYFTIRCKRLDDGTLLDERIDNAKGDVAWSADGKTLFYTVLDDNHRPSRVYRHRIGDKAADDTLVYHEPDAGFFVGLAKTASGRFIVITAHDHTTSEVRVIDARRPTSAPRTIAPRETGVEYDVDDHGERWIVRTNADGAEDFKLVTAPLDASGRADWRDLVAHRPGRLIRATLLFRDHLARLERVDGLPRIVVTRLKDATEHAIPFAEEIFELGLVAGLDYDTTTLRFTYSSPTTPEQVFDYDMARRRRELRKTQEIPSGHDPDAYLARRLTAVGHDGEAVPISVLHRKDTPLDGSAPLLLYGYGAYGFSMPASFSANRFSLVDRGFVYAIAHVRGGMERGYRWYREGKLFDKRNSFLDFIAAARHLIAAGYGARGLIVAHGGSAGGLLVGAVANLAPELFGAVIAEVPFVDVLTTMCDADLPLTPPEWPEWGNPIEDRAAFDYIAGYSPYDNVGARDYPDILVTAGLTDPRVTYWEPAKWVARLRARKTDDNLVVLKTNMAAGHGGAAGRFDKLREVALAYAFALSPIRRSS